MLSLVHCLLKMFVLLQMELGRWKRSFLFSSYKNVQKCSKFHILWGNFSHWLITRRMFADSVHVEWWTCDRDGCYTLWSWQDDGLCFEPSRLRYELSVLLHWQVISGRRCIILSRSFLILECDNVCCCLSAVHRMGLKRNLTAAEIVEQAVYARRLLSREFGSITNVVFMVCILAIYLFSSFFSFLMELLDLCFVREWESHFTTLTMWSKLPT